MRGKRNWSGGPGWRRCVRLRREALRACRWTLPAKELPVGEALIVPTGYAGIPWLISAPTMRRPSVLHDGDPVMRSARAAMRAGLGQSFASVAFPGMGTGTGRLPFDVAAEAMFDGMEEALFSSRWG